MTGSCERVMKRIEGRGWKGRIVPVSRLGDLRREIVGRHERGLLDDRLYREQLGWFSFDPPPCLPEVRSIIVVALAVPQIRVTFRWRGGGVPVVVPPTYAGYSATTARVQADLASWAAEEGCGIAPAELPLKTLAGWSGLADYGRNNICYVEGMGSFLQLVGAFSDLTSPDDRWNEPAMLRRCDSCVACVRRCPTGAIVRERFLLHAENCLTYHNEAASDFPPWIDPSWHHCLIGCMKCQSVCPENKPVLNWYEDRAEFTEEETARLVERVPLERLPGDAAAKIRDLQLNEDYLILCRNLSRLLEPGQAAGTSGRSRYPV